MLIDHATVEVRSGKGGDGAISFLHDKMTEFGGPDGGNGGRGGSVYFEAANNVSNFYNFRHSKVFKAEDGGKGGKKMMHGKDAPDIIVQVPVGTVVYDEETGLLLANFKKAGERALLAQGGRGGRGNATFKSARHRIPRIAQNGALGERKRLKLELKSVADAAIIGFPSVGKSTFLNVVTKANVPTAAYPFTTISPNLGVFSLPDGRAYVLADMPGLIEGAHEGKGLGIDFLRHIERCRVLIHLVALDGEKEPYEAYTAIRNELKGYGARLDERPEIVVGSKIDEEGALERLVDFEKKLGRKVYPLSSLTHQGLEAVLLETARLVEITPEFPLKGEEEAYKVYDARTMGLEDDLTVKRERDGLFRISGNGALKAYRTINHTTNEGMSQLLKALERLKVEEKLMEAGAKDGDEVHLEDFVFEYFR